jgi:hypothetical protein
MPISGSNEGLLRRIPAALGPSDVSGMMLEITVLED